MECEQGAIANGWGEVSYWPADRMKIGDWTPGILRSPELAEAGCVYASYLAMQRLGSINGVYMRMTMNDLITKFEPVHRGTHGSIPVLKSRGSEGQKTIQSIPDEYRVPKKRDTKLARHDDTHTETEKMHQQSAHLLITDGQRNTARLTAVADDRKYPGVGWLTVLGLTPEEAKATAVFLNSAAGRVQLLRNLGRTLEFPQYRQAGISNIRIPDPKDARVRSILADCWERTKDMIVPQFRDGECEVRRLWDEAVAEAMNWDPDELSRIRHLLHKEPHVRGLGYNQYADDLED